jgi:hypothetical protein
MTTDDETPEGQRLLRIYLQDHLAGSMAGHELAKHCAAGNRGTPLGNELEKIAGEIGEDRELLQQLASKLGFGEDPVKSAMAWIAEKAGRLKPNGKLVGGSPLSGLLELEGLAAGIQAKRCLWQALAALEDPDPAISALPLDDLINSAEDQQRRIESHRLEAARRAFA